MDRLIEIKVSGNHLWKDNDLAGVQGEGNITFLRITFDQGWAGYAKSITFFDARGRNPVKRVLTTDLLEDAAQSTLVYRVSIPKEPLAVAGWCSFVIEGYLDEVRQRAVETRLKVAPARDTSGAETPADPTPTQAEQLQEIIGQFDIEAKIVCRKKYFVVYVKEGAGIVELLNIMEAHVALMNLENLRILKEMRNSINRRVNCEAANIQKTVQASTRQVEDIIYLRDYYGFSRLPDNLREMAEVRLAYPEAALKELGEYLSPPVGKSGVNHRLRKLSELAEKLRS